MSVRNILIVGVGGQGALLASKTLGQVLLDAGYDVKVSEVHGMSQRGGSVVTYVRYGEKVYSPIVDKGEADYIVSFEMLEAARYADYLKKDGQIVVNTQQIDPCSHTAAENPLGQAGKEDESEGNQANRDGFHIIAGDRMHQGKEREQLPGCGSDDSDRIFLRDNRSFRIGCANFPQAANHATAPLSLFFLECLSFLRKQISQATALIGKAAMISNTECCLTKTVETQMRTVMTASAACPCFVRNRSVFQRANVAASVPRTCMDGETFVFVSAA